MGSLLNVSNLNKRFGARQVLEGVSFEIREGEVLGLIGPNGAGKTTLLECLASLIPSNDGSINFRGKLLSSFNR